jgi:glycosyltransferase involved in cell wall biosynthesis
MLIHALADLGISTTIVARTSPRHTIRARRRLRVAVRGGWPLFAARRAVAASNIELLEHAMPAGWLESRLIAGVARSANPPFAAVIVADPRSAGALARLPIISVFDAYDAWDESPLYAGDARRVTEIRAGYRRAALEADLITANTQAIANRFLDLGARNVHVLPNAAPLVAPGVSERLHILYLGNVQPRLRVDLLLAAADVAKSRGRRLQIAGAVQLVPEGWSALLQHSAVDFLGPRFGAAREAVLREAAVGLIPHLVDPYTLSQDAMKAWDYLAYAVPVVGTAVPPLSSTPGLGTVAESPAEFARAVASALDGEDPRQARVRRELVAANRWEDRARSLLQYIDELS